MPQKKSRDPDHACLDSRCEYKNTLGNLKRHLTIEDYFEKVRQYYKSDVPKPDVSKCYLPRKKQRIFLQAPIADINEHRVNLKK